MKTNNIKIILALLFAFSISNVFAQWEENEPSKREKQHEQKEELEKDIKNIHEIIAESLNLKIEPIVINNLKPRWFCPFVKQDFYYTDIEVCITNFSLKTATIRFIVWNDKGEIESSFDYVVKGKAQLVFDLKWEDEVGDVLFPKFRGSMELQSDSPAVFPSTHYFSVQGIMPGAEGKWATRVYNDKISLDWQRLD